jgi:hypothetical protein
MSIELAVDRVDYFAAAASVSYTNATAGRVQYIAVEARDTPRLIFFDREGSGNSFETVPQTFLPAEEVSIGDGDGVGGVNLTLQKDVEAFKTEGPSVTDADPVFNVGKVLADSVDAIEAKVFVFTDFIDFDPSDADIDPDPVTIAEADVKAIGKNPFDVITASESIANQPDIVKTDSVAASEAINQLRPHKNVTDTATASDAVNRFDVTTEFDDTVDATEELVKDFTQVSTDDVTAVQSNIKAFTSNVDFDLSDADVDPDPVTASDAVNSFATTKGVTDTATVSEADAKNFTHGGLTDTATVSEADAKNFTHGGLTDTFDAVEGIKNTPSKNISTAVSGSVTFVVTVVSSGGNKFAIDGVTNPALELASGITYTFDVSDSSNSGHPLRFKDGSTSYSDGVTTSGTAGQANATVTFAVPNDAPVSTLLYYCTVHGNAMGNSISVPNSAVENQVLAVAGSPVFDARPVFSDTATMTETVGISITLGDLVAAYPDYVTVSDGYIGGFIQEHYSYTISSTEYFVPHTGVIGAAETLNTVIMAADRVTAPDESSSGLVVNFHYTDVDEDDRALGGHYFNQTPLNAGNSTVGQRAIL